MEDAFLNTDLEGKQIIITGFSSELAIASFQQYAVNNLIFGTYNSNKISLTNKNIKLCKLDLASEIEIKEYVQNIKKDLKNVILVNFAAYKFDGLLANYKVDEWDKTFDINIRSNFLLTKNILPIMIANQWGRIIHISSARGLRGSPGSSAYSASKSALSAFNKSIAKEYARFGITSNIISLGYFNYGMVKELDLKLKQKFIESLPSKLMGSHKDVSSCFEYLVHSPFTNGEKITIDGCMD
jgi:NAD(P)-dependent dehydrogenase (short-subunit alcohol dehydrogenase family)